VILFPSVFVSVFFAQGYPWGEKEQRDCAFMWHEIDANKSNIHFVDKSARRLAILNLTMQTAKDRSDWRICLPGNAFTHSSTVWCVNTLRLNGGSCYKEQN